MYLTCKQKDLANALNVAGRSAATKSTMPILGNVLLEATGSTVNLAATNLETSITTGFSAQVNRPGRVTIPARLLADFVNSLPDANVTLELNESNQTLNLKCWQFEANIKGINALDFPVIAPFPESDVVLSIPFQMFLDSITRTSIAVSTDGSRPILGCINMNCADGKLTLAAADGFRLSVDSMTLDPEVPNENGSGKSPRFTVNVPAKALSLVLQTCRTQGVFGKIGVAMADNGSKIGFKLSAEHDTVVWSQLVGGNYPNYHAIIPKTATVTMSVDSDSFAKSVRLANLFARDAAWVTNLSVDGDFLVVSSKSGEMGNGTAQVPARVSGGPFSIAFNGEFLRDFASVTDGAMIRFEATQSVSAGVFKLDGLDGFLYVIMPMHLQNSA